MQQIETPYSSPCKCDYPNDVPRGQSKVVFKTVLLRAVTKFRKSGALDAQKTEFTYLTKINVSQSIYKVLKN